MGSHVVYDYGRAVPVALKYCSHCFRQVGRTVGGGTAFPLLYSSSSVPVACGRTPWTDRRTNRH